MEIAVAIMPPNGGYENDVDSRCAVVKDLFLS